MEALDVAATVGREGRRVAGVVVRSSRMVVVSRRNRFGMAVAGLLVVVVACQNDMLRGRVSEVRKNPLLCRI